MSNLRAVAATGAGGQIREVASGDILTVGYYITNDSGASLNIDSAGTLMFLKLASVTIATLGPSGLSMTSGYGFSGDGSALTNLSVGNLNGQVAPAKGGTGLATLTAHGVLMGQGTSPLTVSSAGNVDQVFTSRGASLDGVYADPITGTTGTASLGSTTTVLTTTGTYQDILSISLPSAGRYFVEANWRSDINVSSGAGWITGKFRNTTDGVDIADTVTLGANATLINQWFMVTAATCAIIVVNAAKTITLQAARFAATTFAISQISSDPTTGLTTMRYIKLNRQ